MKQEKTEKIDIEKLPKLNIGLVGHIDHGKSTLLARLTGKMTDTHSEELKRGITIKLGYADLILREGNKENGKPVRYISFVDAPGHEMLMATMLSGAAIIDAAILVIAANEGIKPQTREHLVALQAKGIKNIIIIQNKIDLVDKEQAMKNYNEIKKFVKATIAENSPIIPVSAQQNVNIDKILDELLKIKIPNRDEKSEPFFLAARSFDINKPGTEVKKLNGVVLGGVLRKGKLKVGDKIEIKPGILVKKQNQEVYKTLNTKIISLHKGKYNVKEITPGSSVSIETELDPFIGKADSLSGCVVGLENKLPELQYEINVKFDLFKEVLGLSEKKHKKTEQISAGEMLLFSVGTSITIGNVKKTKDNKAEIHLKIPVVANKGDKLGIARNIQGHWRLIGFGEIM